MKKIAVIGGSYLQLPVVQEAKKMGIEVHCFSWIEGAVCREYCDFFYPISITEKDAILKECIKIGINGILTIASDLASITVDYIADAMGLISNPYAYSKITTNKYLMRECFKKNNIPSPVYFVLRKDNINEVPELNYPVIVKPTDRSGSRGVQKVNKSSELKGAIQRALEESFIGEVIIEEFISGNEISVESISYKGEHYILAFTDKVTTGPPYFVELEHHQPSVIELSKQKEVGKIVEDALNALKIEYGASHAELKITEEGDIKVIEIGARMGGDFIGSDLVKLSTGYNYLNALVDLSLGNFKIPHNLSSSYSGVYFLSKETEKYKKIIENSFLYPQIIKSEILNNNLKTIKSSADRSGYLIYKSNEKFVI